MPVSWRRRPSTRSPILRSRSSAGLIKPVSIGPIALDFGWSLTMLCVIVGMYIATWLQAA
ncbi:hypothetical protein [Rathayibacter oskolensis]|uniref:hypothetical protein n=1 Tax=Rathayibacter oskolensis TaxID=1891671 RepID=UPI0034664C43